MSERFHHPDCNVWCNERGHWLLSTSPLGSPFSHQDDAPLPAGTGKHRLRDDPYPDELDQLFCEEDETLCEPDRPCLCCWVARTEAGESS